MPHAIGEDLEFFTRAGGGLRRLKVAANRRREIFIVSVLQNGLEHVLQLGIRHDIVHSRYN